VTSDGRKTLTAAQEILLGAADIDAKGKQVFSEWDLTISTWERNKNRFGCRGYESEYPDHKRVMMEIMGTTKKENPIRRGWIVKVQPNTYSLTNVGRSEAEKLKVKGTTKGVDRRSPQAIYDAIAPLHKSSVFRKHVKNADEPRMWLGAASFYQLTSADPQHMVDRMKTVEAAVENAIAWLEENNAQVIHRGVSGSGEGVSLADLTNLQRFDQLLRERFSGQIEVIKSRLK
jgi:hypothetical protein